MSEPALISEILPGVLQDIEYRMDAHQRAQRANEQARKKAPTGRKSGQRNEGKSRQRGSARRRTKR